MLPLPGVPSSSWAMFRARFLAIFAGANPRVCTAFWFFGLINNVLYVIILSAALDLVGPTVPKGVVLLADIIPSFLVKLCAPYFIHVVPYPIRIILMAGISTTGMLLIALTRPNTDGSTDGGTIGTKMSGVALASLSSGFGELSFLSLTHFYGQFSLAAWGSGTGGAGLIGAGAYVFLTSVGFGVRNTLLASSLLPIILLVNFFVVLPLGPMRRAAKQDEDYAPVPSDDLDQGVEDPSIERAGLLRQPSSRRYSHPSSGAKYPETWQALFLRNLRRSRSLFVPYMVPLFLVYVSEYTINLGVAPTLLFPLPATPFPAYRYFYPTYSAIYQLGVFISRSSTPFLRLHNLYLPSFLQILNLSILVLHALFPFVPNVWFMFIIFLWEGLLGGAVYVNTFAEIQEKVESEEREFSLGAVSVSDSGGICLAGFLSMAVEVSLCKWQVGRGRNWCKEL